MLNFHFYCLLHTRDLRLDLDKNSIMGRLIMTLLSSCKDLWDHLPVRKGETGEVKDCPQVTQLDPLLSRSLSPAQVSLTASCEEGYLSNLLFPSQGFCADTLLHIAPSASPEILPGAKQHLLNTQDFQSRIK